MGFKKFDHCVVCDGDWEVSAQFVESDDTGVTVYRYRDGVRLKVSSADVRAETREEEGDRVGRGIYAEERARY